MWFHFMIYQIDKKFLLFYFLNTAWIRCCFEPFPPSPPPPPPAQKWLCSSFLPEKKLYNRYIDPTESRLLS